MRFKNNVLDPKVNEAIKEAERLLDWNSDLLNAIREKNDFKYDSGRGKIVALRLHDGNSEPLSVFTYVPKNPFTKAIGYFDGTSMHINLRKLSGMSVNNIVGNLLHEWSHYVGFTHGNNFKTKEKVAHSVPYFVSKYVANMNKEKETLLCVRNPWTLWLTKKCYAREENVA